MAQVRSWAWIYLSQDRALTQAFGEALARWITEWLPAGGAVLEVLPGSGWTGLALARTGRYSVTVMTDSEAGFGALRRFLRREGPVPDLVIDDVWMPGPPQFDLVFTTVAVETLPSKVRASLLRSLASRSRRYILLFLPNPRCYPYWLGQVSYSTARRGGRPLMTAPTGLDVLEVFSEIGVERWGTQYVGAEWVEALIRRLPGIGEPLRDCMVAVHRTLLADSDVRHPWVALLGCVTPKAELPSGWKDGAPSVRPETELASLYRALADALASRIRAECRARGYRRRWTSLARAYQSYRQDREGYIAGLRGEVQRLQDQLDAIISSTGWALLQWLWKIRLWIAPRGSLRDRWLRWGARTLRLGPRRFVSIFGHIRRWSPTVFRDAYGIEDNSRVVLYSRREDLFPDYQPRRSLLEPPQRRVRVALIATVWNERENVDVWFQSLCRQTRLPDEVLIVDAGSTDGTLERLEALASQAPFPCQVFVEPGANIAQGRNKAISQARSEVIAVTDLGCRLRPDWLECLIGPFERDADLQVVAGWYEAIDRQGRPFRRRRWPTMEEVWPSTFLPSSRSLAFTKEAWETVGGYPAWLTLTGEDTYFALELKRDCSRWAFVPEAVVEWYAPDRLRAFWQKVYAWSTGDGESGVLAHTYWHSLVRVVLGSLAGLIGVGLILAGVLWGSDGGSAWLIGAGTGMEALLLGAVGYYARSLSGVLWEAGAEVARVLGFLEGLRRRPLVEARRADLTRGLFFMLSGVPIDDTGGGARCTQMTLELLRQGYRVVFIYRFPRYESVDLNLKIRHPNLQVYALQDFPVRQFLETHEGLIRSKPTAAIVEFPVGEFVPLIESLKTRGTAIVYDLLDDWDTQLGGDWYRPDIERRIIQQADVLIATAPVLQERLRQWSGDRPVTLIPNAVNTRLFDRHRSYVCPPDMPQAEWTIIYTGALWGSWFDWDLLQAVARAYPEAAVVVIGDYRGQCRKPPPNLHFLGLKPQRDLPAYLAHADVALIPWKVNAITRATSPLKVYEYVAMGKPVVAPDLPTLADIPLVLRARDRSEFITYVEQARSLSVPEAVLEDFIARHNWTTRISTLLQLLQECPSWRGKTSWTSSST